MKRDTHGVVRARIPEKSPKILLAEARPWERSISDQIRRALREWTQTRVVQAEGEENDP